MDKSTLAALVAETAQHVKTPEDLSELTRLLTKTTLEAALNAELDEHLSQEREQSNSRNGYSPKQISTESGTFELATPRDRQSRFEPQLVEKRQTRVCVLDDRILSLYAKGMSTREIVAMLEELYGADVSPTLISKVTDSVMERVIEWQARPLEAVYPIVYLDCIHLKIRQDKQVINKAVYLALGVNLEGQKELLGIWLAEKEGAKFWLNVLTELQNRGVKDILIACVDGLTGFPEAINTAFPQTQVQLCIVHMVRNSLRYVAYKDYRKVTSALKQIYRAATEEEALLALEQFAGQWDEKYPKISQSWYNHWDNLNTLFRYPEAIRKAIYTTNAIESLNSVIQKAVKKRKVFPNDKAAVKVVWLAITDASKKWTMPIRDWKAALNRFIIEFDQRLENYL